jgi:hypothetical protein
MKKRALTFILLLVFIVLGGAHSVAADEVTKWNETASKAAFESGLSDPPRGIPFFEARIYAMTHVAIHNEGGLSRILVGFHFRKAVESGAKHGRKIGDHAVNHFLRPVEKKGADE